MSLLAACWQNFFDPLYHPGLSPFNRSSRIKKHELFFLEQFVGDRERSNDDDDTSLHSTNSVTRVHSRFCPYPAPALFFIWKAIVIHPATYYPLARKPLSSNHPFSPPSLPFSSLLPLFSPSRITLFYLYLSSTHRNCKL